MSGQIVPVVHTQLWRDRRVDAPYTPQITPVSESSSTRLSCGCHTTNADLAAWCVLHSEAVQNQSRRTEAAYVPRSLPVIPASALPGEEMLQSEDVGPRPLSQAFECVSMTDSEREYLYQRLYEGVRRQQEQRGGDAEASKVTDDGPVFVGTEKERDEQFRDWIWHEFQGWVEFMYPNGRAE